MGCIDNVATIPYFVHEGIVTRMEKANKRLIGALVVAVAALLIESTMIINERDEEDD